MKNLGKLQSMVATITFLSRDNFFFISQCGHDHMVIFGPTPIFSLFSRGLYKASLRTMLGESFGENTSLWVETP